MVPGKLKLLASAGLLMLAVPLSATAQEGSLQGMSLLGKPMVTTHTRSANIAATETLDRAARDAKAEFERNMTVDSATWYGRILFYQGYSKESAAVYDQALKRFPNSGKLLRHRAHRAFSLRDFDKSIELGLKAAKLYENQPLEREKPGPDYFPGDPDVVQYYLYYHLGQAYFASMISTMPRNGLPNRQSRRPSPTTSRRGPRTVIGNICRSPARASCARRKNCSTIMT